jgi:hypothetical protein
MAAEEEDWLSAVWSSLTDGLKVATSHADARKKPMQVVHSDMIARMAPRAKSQPKGCARHWHAATDGLSLCHGAGGEVGILTDFV